MHPLAVRALHITPQTEIALELKALQRKKAISIMREHFQPMILLEAVAVWT